MQPTPTLARTFIVPTAFVAVLWIIHFVSWMTGAELGTLGIYPRKWENWYHIFTAPLIHGSWEHLLSNSVPLLLLGWFLVVTYPRQAILVYLAAYLTTGILVFIFGRYSFHIGASGIVYGMASFLFIGGIIRGDTGAIAIALIVAFLYGSLVWGILPHQPGVSWESHLFGGLTGIVLAAVLIRKEEEPEEPVVSGKFFRDFIRSEKGSSHH